MVKYIQLKYHDILCCLVQKYRGLIEETNLRDMACYRYLAPYLMPASCSGGDHGNHIDGCRRKPKAAVLAESVLMHKADDHELPSEASMGNIQCLFVFFWFTPWKCPMRLPVTLIFDKSHATPLQNLSLRGGLLSIALHFISG